MTRELPASMALAWGRVKAGSRGPRKGLTVETIVEAACAIAQSGGLAAVSMARVAKELGFTTMSLYRYIDSKDLLVELMADYALGAPPDFDSGGDWRERLRAVALAEFERVLGLEWWLTMPISGAPTGPNNMLWLESLLSSLSDTPLSEAQKVQLALNTSLYVIGRARLVVDITSGDDIDFGTVMPEVLDAERFPSILAAIEGGGFDALGDPRQSDEFSFGLDRLLDGIDVMIARQRTTDAH